MAINTASFNKFSQANLPVSATDLYTAPALTTAAVLSAIFSNKTAGIVYVTVDVVRSGGTPVLNIVTSAPIPVGGALELINNKPIILATGDKIRALCSTGGASAIDVTGSLLETT